jgi:hypothetical protein
MRRNHQAFLCALLILPIGIQCKTVTAEHPANLVGRWKSAESPSSRGYIFNSDGTGRRAGTDNTIPGYPIDWAVVDDGMLKIRGYGEEGETGGFEPFSYRLQGEKLFLRQQSGAWSEYVKY